LVPVDIEKTETSMALRKLFSIEKTQSRRNLRLSLMLWSVLALMASACGGGDSPSNPTPAPTNAMTLVAATPTPTGTPIAQQSTFKLTFSEPIDTASVTDATVQLVPVSAQGSEAPALEVQRAVEGNTVTVQPVVVLSAATTFRLKLDAGLRSTSGKPLQSAASMDFVTASSLAGDTRTWGPVQSATGGELPLVQNLTQVTQDSVAIDAAGNALVAFVQTVEEQPDPSGPSGSVQKGAYNMVLWINRFDAQANAWQAPVRVWSSPRSVGIREARIAFGPTGDAVVVWGVTAPMQPEDSRPWPDTRQPVALMFSRVAAGQAAASPPQVPPVFDTFAFGVGGEYTRQWLLKPAGANGAALVWTSDGAVVSSFFDPAREVWAPPSLIASPDPVPPTDAVCFRNLSRDLTFNARGDGVLNILTTSCDGRQRIYRFDSQNGSWGPIDPPEDPGDDVLKREVRTAINSRGDVMLWWRKNSAACACLKMPTPRLYEAANRNWRLLPRIDMLDRIGDEAPRVDLNFVAAGPNFALRWEATLPVQAGQPREYGLGVAIFDLAQNRWSFSGYVQRFLYDGWRGYSLSVHGHDNGAVTLNYFRDIITRNSDGTVASSDQGLATTVYDPTIERWSQPAHTLQGRFVGIVNMNAAGDGVATSQGRRLPVLDAYLSVYGGMDATVFR
jgi:hypothetical protein